MNFKNSVSSSSDKHFELSILDAHSDQTLQVDIHRAFVLNVCIYIGSITPPTLKIINYVVHSLNGYVNTL